MAVRKPCCSKGCKSSPRCEHPWWLDVMHNRERYRMPVDDFALARGATAPVTSKQEAEKVWEPRFIAEIVSGKDPRVPIERETKFERPTTVADLLKLYRTRYVEVEPLKSRAGMLSQLNVLSAKLGTLPATALERPDADALGLPEHQVGDGGQQPAGVIELRAVLAGVVHGAGGVEDEDAAEVGLLVVLLDVRPVGAAEDAPVDVTRIDARHVLGHGELGGTRKHAVVMASVTASLFEPYQGGITAPKPPAGPGSTRAPQQFAFHASAGCASGMRVRMYTRLASSSRSTAALRSRSYSFQRACTVHL